jgi:hypothetical protein
MQPDNAQAEPAAVVTPEPSAAPQAPGSEVTPPTPANEQAKVETPKAEDEMVSKKELLKAQMEANNFKNKVEKFEKEKEAVRQAELSEVERLKEQLGTYEAKEARREAEGFRNTVIDEYLVNDPAALKAAKALIAKNPGNLTWGMKADGSNPTEEEAKADLVLQLDALKEAIGSVTPPPADGQKPTSAAHANNPGNSAAEVSPDRQAAIAEARKTGNWSKVLGGMETVKFQSSRNI